LSLAIGPFGKRGYLEANFPTISGPETLVVEQGESGASRHAADHSGEQHGIAEHHPSDPEEVAEHAAGQ
jgi:hypothetical protein